jgi:hypothetical protein
MMPNCLHELGLAYTPKVGERVSLNARGCLEYGTIKSIQGWYCTVVLDRDGSSIDLYPSEMRLV